MGRSTMSGPVMSRAGFLTGTDTVQAAVTTSTLTVPAFVDDGSDTYNGYVIPLDRAAGIAVTLPASTGSQAVYQFYIKTSVTSNSTTIKVANSTDVMNGSASIGGGTAALFGTLPASDTVTMNGSTTGGLIGSWVEVKDVAAGYWLVTALLIGSGTPATCFSATV